MVIRSGQSVTRIDLVISRVSVWQCHKSSLLQPDDHAFNVINPPVPAAPRQLKELSGPPARPDGAVLTCFASEQGRPDWGFGVLHD